MSCYAEELVRWAKSLHPKDIVGIDEGGLTLLVYEEDAYFEIGGMDEDDMEDDDD